MGMKKISIIIIFVLVFGISFCQVNHSKDTIFYYSLWKINNEKIYNIFDDIIEKNSKCLKKKQWEKARNSYYFEFNIIYDKNELKITIFSVADKGSMYSFMDLTKNNSLNENFGVIIYKNELFMGMKSPNISSDMFETFFKKTDEQYGVYSDKEDGSGIIINDKKCTITFFGVMQKYLIKKNKFVLIDMYNCNCYKTYFPCDKHLKTKKYGIAN